LGELWIIYVVIFCAAVLAIQGAYWLFAEGRRTRRAVNRRLVLSTQNGNPQEVFEALKRERGFGGFENKRFTYWNDLLTQTGLRLDGKLLAGSALSLSVLFFVGLGFILGFGLVALLTALALACFSLLLFLLTVRRKRIGRFSEQLPDAIDVIVRGVKSGYPFIVALGLVAKEMPDPIGTEFGMTSDEINFGLGIHKALDNLYRRVGQEDLLFFIMATKIQSETGGSLAEVLSRLAGLLRHRAKLYLKVRAITAEGRLSALFLSAMPFLLIAIVSLVSPGYYGEILNHPFIMPAFVVGFILLTMGNFIMYRMVNFKV
jgi:tight adherence protein B